MPENEQPKVSIQMTDYDEHPRDRRHVDHDGTVTARLERIERKVDDLVRCQDAQAKSIRTLEDWRIEMNVYMRQARWTLLVALGALLAGSVNIVLALVTHP